MKVKSKVLSKFFVPKAHRHLSLYRKLFSLDFAISLRNQAG